MCSQEKDRAKFGPEYGDRFCMLQLVGRHEMDKVQLQHESEGGHKIMVSGRNCCMQLVCLSAWLRTCLLMLQLCCVVTGKHSSFCVEHVLTSLL
jgi:hypothetical protein